MTEALAAELGPQRGAEELTANLNRVFHAIIAELDAYGGDVICFSGDAVTCWIDGDDGTRAVACGLAMQETIGRAGRILTPAGTHVELGMKVAVVVGAARRFVVGDPKIQLLDVLAAVSSTSSPPSSTRPRRARWFSASRRSKRSAIASRSPSGEETTVTSRDAR